MSSGGSAGDAGSVSQEATNFEDYNTSTDLVDSSVSIDEFATSPSSTTSSTGFEGSPEMGGSRTDTQGPSYDARYDSSGADPAVPADYRAGIGKTDYFNPKDTATSYSNNLKAEVRANQMAEEVGGADYEGDPIKLMDDRDYGDAGFDD